MGLRCNHYDLFGVNYYLTGLHSYATGDPVPIPAWVPITVSVLLVLSVLSGIKNKRNNKIELGKQPKSNAS